jgi:CRISPR/Cas system-associated endoribonuclease Cas2
VAVTIVDWVVTFDVVTDHDRRAVHRALERHGHRALYSVYELDTTARRLDAALRTCAERVGGGGHLLALPFCPDCQVIRHGDPREQPPDALWRAW